MVNIKKELKNRSVEVEIKDTETEIDLVSVEAEKKGWRDKLNGIWDLHKLAIN